MALRNLVLGATVYGLGGTLLFGCSSASSEETESPTPKPGPSLEQVWQRQRIALEKGNIPNLSADSSPSVDSSFWLEDDNGTVNFDGGYENIERAYGGIVQTLDDPLKVVATVDETQPPIIFSIASGSGVDFASVVSVFDDQSKIIFHSTYVLETLDAEQELTSGQGGSGLEPHHSMEQRWLDRDLDSLMELYRDDSKVLYFDAVEGAFHVSRGITEIREFFENTNLTVPFVQPKSVVSQRSDAGDACKSWLSGFHADGVRRLSMLMHVSHGEDSGNCSSALQSSWIQYQVMGYFPGNSGEAP